MEQRNSLKVKNYLWDMATIFIYCYFQETTTKYHTVAAGENLGSIARKYNVTVKQLVNWNKLANPDALSIGQKLRVTVSAYSGNTKQEKREEAEEKQKNMKKCEKRDGKYEKKLAIAL